MHTFARKAYSPGVPAWRRPCGSAVRLSSRALPSRHVAHHCAGGRLGDDDAFVAPDHEALDSQQLRWSRRVTLGLAAAGAPLALLAAAPHAGRAALVDDEAEAERVFDAANGSVVSVVLTRLLSGGGEEDEGIGTGIIWDRYGHVVTNYHCISAAVKDRSGAQVTRVVVTPPAALAVPGGGGGVRPVPVSYDVAVIGTDAQHDLAVLRVLGPSKVVGAGGGGNGSGGADTGASQTLPPPIPVGTSADLKVGQSVYAVGNTRGLTKTLSAGVISGTNRAIPSPAGTKIYGVLQTDASISAGNSGGPLLDSSGRMVGLNTATFTRSGSGRGSGVNFALPADMLRELVPNLIVYGNAMGKR